MGTTAQALISHTLLSSELADLPHRLAPERAVPLARAASKLADLLKATNPHFKEEVTWTIEVGDPWIPPDELSTAWDRDGLPVLHGPGGLSIHVGRHTLDIGPAIRWTRFLDESIVFSAVHNVAVALAQEMGSPQVVWVPEACPAHDMAWDGHKLDEILEWLAANWGPPAAKPTDIVQHAVGKPYRFEVDYHGYLVFRSPCWYEPVH